jgi:hypothetical protein
MPLKKEDGHVLQSLRKRDVLRDIEGNRLAADNGVILVTCGDGDQFADLFQHKAGMVAGTTGKPRFHTLSLNGGALLIPKGSPFNQDIPYDQVLLENIREAVRLKDIFTVAVYVHAPCGKAKSASLDFADVIGLAVDAKRRIRDEVRVSGLKVAAFCHVDWEDGKRTYHISAEAWDQWSQSPPVSMLPSSIRSNSSVS